MNAELACLWVIGVVVAILAIGGGLLWIASTYHPLKAIAVWIGNKIADLGGGGPRI